jgi:hypothetical protein
MACDKIQAAWTKCTDDGPSICSGFTTTAGGVNIYTLPKYQWGHDVKLDAVAEEKKAANLGDCIAACSNGIGGSFVKDTCMCASEIKKDSCIVVSDLKATDTTTIFAKVPLLDRSICSS